MSQGSIFAAKTGRKARWRKLNGIAKVEFIDGTMCETGIHWYEAHGIGAKEYKIKRVIIKRVID